MAKKLLEPTVKLRPGPRTLYPDKVRAPVSSLLTAPQLALLSEIKQAGRLSIGDIFGKLLEQHGQALLKELKAA